MVCIVIMIVHRESITERETGQTNQANHSKGSKSNARHERKTTFKVKQE